jgi:hypothetical protein
MGHPFRAIRILRGYQSAIVCPSKVTEMIEAILKLDVDRGRWVAAQEKDQLHRTGLFGDLSRRWDLVVYDPFAIVR